MPISSRRCCEGVIVAGGAAPASAPRPSIVEDVVLACASPASGARWRPANCMPKRTLSATRHVGKHARRLEGARDAVRGVAVRAAAGEVVAAGHEQLPEVGAITPEMALKKVVLPAPLGPMMPTSSPASQRGADRVDRDQAAEAHGELAGFEQGPSCAPQSWPCRQRSRLALPQRGQAARQVQHAQDQQQPQHHHVAVGSCSRSVSASRLKTMAAISGPPMLAAPPISAISTVWKPMKGLNTVGGSM